jgi:hypothetical protein
LSGNIAAYLDITIGIRAHNKAEPTNTDISHELYIGNLVCVSIAIIIKKKVGDLQSLTSRNVVAKYKERK